MRFAPFFLLALVSCQPNYEDVDVKFVGVGYNPDEVGPSPTPYGGVVEYSWINFAGAGLSLALMQLGSFDEVGPAMLGYAPPYAAVYGFSYIFDAKLAAADSLGGVTSVPPEQDDTCYTTFEATGPIGSFKTVDVGDEMRVLSADGTKGLVLDRLPGDMPSNMQDLFVYYSGLEPWVESPRFGYQAAAGVTDPSEMESVLVQRATFPFGEQVEFSFSGSVATAQAPIASIPMPSSSVGNTAYNLPTYPGGVMLEWTGTQYNGSGKASNDGPYKTCLTYYMDSSIDPNDLKDGSSCRDVSGSASPTDDSGQMYTGPWDTDDGQVMFRWEPTGNPDEVVSIAVRFLGPIDQNDPNYKEYVLSEDTRRAPLCQEGEGEWLFDDAFLNEDGEYITTMRGDPFYNLAEVTCRWKDDGEQALTLADLQGAMDYARAHGAQGAVFYFSRSTEADVEVPAAKDPYDQRLDISPIKLSSRAISIGRFWYEE